VTWRASEADLERIPRTGPALVVANHPSGILDGAVLATHSRRIRPNVRFLANEALAQIPELRELIIAVNPFTTESAARYNHRAIRELLDHFQQGGMAVVFPAGEVAHFQIREWAVTDPHWRTGLSRTLTMAARRTCAPVIVPVHVSGGNSFTFQAAGVLHPGLRTAMLARELWNKRARVDVRIGKPIDAAACSPFPPTRSACVTSAGAPICSPTATSSSRVREFRFRRGGRGKRQPIAAGPGSDELATEVASLQPHRKLIESGDFSVYLAPLAGHRSRSTKSAACAKSPFALRAKAPAGPRPRPLRRHYLHLFVWNRAPGDAGAYRLAGSDASASRVSIRHALQLRPPLPPHARPRDRARPLVRAAGVSEELRSAVAVVERHRQIRRRKPTLQAPVRTGQHQQSISIDLTRADDLVP
jgi:1-acyl-sn-glycerol-3-phosphate acyltransferase